MKLGVLANKLEFRYDIRLFIEELAEAIDIIVYVNDHQHRLIPENCKTLLIEDQRFGIFNKILKKLYALFGKLPRPSKFYHFYQFKIYKKSNRISAYIDYIIGLISPRFLTYDWYLSKLKPVSLQHDEIDAFLIFTPHENDAILAALAQTNKPVFAYLHSWDHTAKLKKISLKRFQYMVWDNHLKDDLEHLFDMPTEQTFIVGSTQLAVIQKYLAQNALLNFEDSEDYLYYIGTFGDERAAKQEVQLIELVANRLKEVRSDLKLKVRPYPNLSNWSIYEKLILLDNVYFDEYIGSKREVILTEQDVWQRLEAINKSKGVIHAGTTVGIEANFFKKPAIYLNIHKGIKNLRGDIPLRKYWSQYHLLKYYDKYKFNFISTNEGNLTEFFKNIDSSIMISENCFELSSFESIITRMTGEIKNRTYLR